MSALEWRVEDIFTFFKGKKEKQCETDWQLGNRFEGVASIGVPHTYQWLLLMLHISTVTVTQTVSFAENPNQLTTYRHSGHVLVLVSHGMMQVLWNLWEHGSCLGESFTVYSARQMAHMKSSQMLSGKTW